MRHLKNKAEADRGYEVTDVVVGRPVYFVDGDSHADANAQSQLEAIALQTGFKNIHFQFEPIAAALDYEQTVNAEELVLIIDIGGGTSDFSLVRVSPACRGKADRKNDILANDGVHVGGTDMDKRLSFSQVMPLMGLGSRMKSKPQLEIPPSCFHDLSTWHKIVFLYTRKAMHEARELRALSTAPHLVERFIHIIEKHEGHRLAGDVEAAKIELSDAETTKLDLNYIEPDLECVIDRKTFEEAIHREREKISSHISECIAQSGAQPSDINTIFLTGGTTSIPSILETCRSVVPEAKVIEGDKEGSVGIGLAIDAAIKFGNKSLRSRA